MSEHDFTNVRFRQQLGERKLAGSRCRTCGALYLPPRPLCTTCYGEDLTWEQLSGDGELAAFTVVHIAPSAMIDAGYGRDKPYVSGIVKLTEGPSISAQIIGVDASKPESIRIGTPVHAVFIERKREEDTIALAFEVVR